MSPRNAAAAEEVEPPDPRETAILGGHAEAERTLLDAYRSGRVHHAWLIGGPRGVGKATLAYRFARFVLAHPDPASPAVRAATTLAVDPFHPVARQVAGKAHPDLLTLERSANEKGDLRTVITVDEVRRTIPFFGSTAGMGGWRICLVDTADDLQTPNAANALLKSLEEPPNRALFLLVSHSPGRLLATIRSRCRRLDLRPLPREDVIAAAAAAAGRSADDAEIVEAAAGADGSVAQALVLLGSAALEVRNQTHAALARLPETDLQTWQALGGAMTRTGDAAFTAFIETVRDWLSARIHGTPATPARLVRFADAWERIEDAVREAATYNLDPKPLVLAVFGWLAEAER